MPSHLEMVNARIDLYIHSYSLNLFRTISEHYLKKCYFEREKMTAFN